MYVRFMALFAFAGLLLQAETVDGLFQAIRASNLAEVRSALAKGSNVNARDAEGSTPLMYAALYSPDTACLRLLLDNGANPNAVNNFGATALIWGTGSLDKVKLLVERGADVNAQSKLGKTALLVAASRDGAGPVVSYLLAHRARVDVKDELAGMPMIPVGGGGATALIQAAKARDGEALDLLIKQGIDINAKEKNGSTALLSAVAYRNHHNIKALIAHGADVNVAHTGGFSPLIVASMRNDTSTVSLLLAHGAKVDMEDMWGNTALMWAGYSDDPHSELVTCLLKAGANPDHKNKMGETAFTWASRRGTTHVAEMLGSGVSAANKKPELPLTPVSLSENRDLFLAVEKSLPLLQTSGPAVFKQRGCVSCHNNLLPAMAAALARTQGHKVDEQAMDREHKSIISLLKPAHEVLVENGDNIPDLQITAPYALMALAAHGHQPDSMTDALVHNLANKQNADGSWTIWAPRPPIEYEDIQATALSLRALQLYKLEGRHTEFESRIRKAGVWLTQSSPKNASDENWKLLGLFWSGVDSRQLTKSARQILAHQRPDGGWAQLPKLSSDAYATGQTLYALGTAGMLENNSLAAKRAVTYLLTTQQPDGTWRVKSRAFPFQPYFESGFPYGADQWISAAGSSWATIALTMADMNSSHQNQAFLQKP